MGTLKVIDEIIQRSVEIVDAVKASETAKVHPDYFYIATMQGYLNGIRDGLTLKSEEQILNEKIAAHNLMIAKKESGG